MKGIYNIRTLFEKYYSEYGNYIDAAAKFVTALILFMQINGRIGGKSIFGNIFVELILADFSSMSRVSYRSVSG